MAFKGAVLARLLKCSTLNVSHQPSQSFFTGVGGLGIRASQVLLGEPPKKKKKADPQLEMARQQRFLKRLKKVQHKLGRPELKPVPEFMVDQKLLEENRKRNLPPLSPEEQDRRALLQKRWSRFKFSQHVNESKLIEMALRSQDRALRELRLESEDLYQQAIQRDQNLFPEHCKGPTATPPIEEFEKDCVDGEFIDMTRQYK